MRIIVLGYLVRGPLGGMVWHHLHYAAGLARLGHDVYFMEDSDNYESCYDPSRGVLGKDPAYGLKFAGDVFARFGLQEKWAYYDEHTTSWMGPCASRGADLFRTADLLLNVSGVNPIREWTVRPPHRALIDTDPVFTQVRHLTVPQSREAAATHTAFFTFGENFGKADCSVPDDGFPWQPTRQPVVMKAWRASPGIPSGNFTTVMQWESYPAVTYGGRFFGTKAASFGPYMDLPLDTTARLELALGGPNAPRAELSAKGWVVTNPLEAIPDARGYQDFIRRSKAEFSLAKQAYAVTRSGWFSERSAVYLASGRPVVTQDTGFSTWMETGAGVLAFDSPDSAARAIESVICDYEGHCRRARQLAEGLFESGAVLNYLVERATIA